MDAGARLGHPSPVAHGAPESGSHPATGLAAWTPGLATPESFMARPGSIRLAALTGLLLALLAPASAVAGAEHSPPAGAGPGGGPYEGQVFNGGGMDPVLAVFSRSAEGTWTGSYVLGEEEDIATGTLDSCLWETAQLIVCGWTDRHGTGFARLLFSSDYRSFRGFWGSTMDELSLPWDGARQ